jgi:hypothetical protein
MALDLGYRPANVLLLEAPASTPSNAAGAHAFVRDVETRLARIPGVAASGAVSLTPLELGPIGDDRRIYAEGFEPADRAAEPVVGYLAATPGYFSAMGIRLERGRLFTARDDERAAPVAVISESTARRLWGDSDPLGKRIVVSAPHPPALLVVGVVADGRTRGLAGAALEMYVPAAQADIVPAAWAIRVAVPAAHVAPAIRAAILEIDGSRAVTIEPFEARIRAAERPWMATAAIMGGFAAVALLLALAGVHALVAYAVSTRTREFGLRMALGATRGRIAWEVASPMAGPLLFGTAAGLAAAALATASMRALLFGVQPLDPGSYAAGAVLVMAAVASACITPARRATTTAPAAALRHW